MLLTLLGYMFTTQLSINRAGENGGRILHGNHLGVWFYRFVLMGEEGQKEAQRQMAQDVMSFNDVATEKQTLPTAADNAQASVYLPTEAVRCVR